MSGSSSLRVRLVAIVFFAVVPALSLMIYTGLHWFGLVAGILAILAAWLWGELFIVRHVNRILRATQQLATGDLTTRTGMPDEMGEIGELAHGIDSMAAALERKVDELERAEKKLLNRAHQQTVVAALGQFALVAHDLDPLFNHAVIFLAQALEVEYAAVFARRDEDGALVLRAATGWKEDHQAGTVVVESDPGTLTGYTLQGSEPVIVFDLRRDGRFRPQEFLTKSGVVSSVSVVINGHEHPFGILAVQTTSPRTFNEDDVHFLQVIANLLAMAIERKRTEPEIQKLAAFAQFNPNPVLELSGTGEVTYANEAALQMTGAIGCDQPRDLLPVNVTPIIQTCLATGQSRLQLNSRIATRTLSWSFFPVATTQVVHCYAEDITDRISLEAQLLQSQKMESVGQLAAGVAHDFNNLLTVIQGHSGLLMTRPGLPPELISSLQTVSLAADRAAGLTRQLLMFSRKKVMQPQVVDLNDVLGNMTKMLKRVLGENITLETTHSARTPPVLGDPGMIEQVVMNLAVNARDAMQKGGRLIINASPVQFDDSVTRRSPAARAGLHVCLRVADTGCGMDAQTKSRIFEPFFTTKEAGKGTGLGLATVYGIVKQHQGWIEVDSEPGEGTTFSIYLPATSPGAAKPAPPDSTRRARGGSETILVVEDEEVLREMADLILSDCGYRVLLAASGPDALQIWEEHFPGIDLLLTDMVMPGGMSGKDLAEMLVARKPDLKLIFTSGYSADELGADIVGITDKQILQKPYNNATLTRAVRECLDAATARRAAEARNQQA